MPGSIKIALQSREAHLGLTGTSVQAVQAGACSAGGVQQPGGSNTGPVTFHPAPLFMSANSNAYGSGLCNEEACAQPLK